MLDDRAMKEAAPVSGIRLCIEQPTPSRTRRRPACSCTDCGIIRVGSPGGHDATKDMEKSTCVFIFRVKDEENFVTKRIRDGFQRDKKRNTQQNTTTAAHYKGSGQG